MANMIAETVFIHILYRETLQKYCMFHPPRFICISLMQLRSLNMTELSGGVGEASSD